MSIRSDMISQWFCVRPISKRRFLEIVQVAMNIIHSMSRKTPCRLYIHLAFTYSIGPLKSSVKQTWTSSAFSTNKSA